MSDRIIYLDAGHGGSDPGALGIGQTAGMRETDLNLRMAFAIETELNEGWTGHRVVLNRRKEVTQSLAHRTNEANRLGAAVLVSIHCNSHTDTSANGYESFIHNTNATQRDRDLHRAVHDAQMSFYRQHNIRDRGRKTANFHMVREARMPSILVENLFMRNIEILNFNDPEFETGVALATATGIADFLGLQRRPVVVPQKRGWVEENGQWSFYRSNGRRHVGWRLVDGRWYYMNEDGIMQDGWLRTGGQWYFLNPERGNPNRQSGAPHGAMVDRWVKTDGHWYWLNPERGTVDHNENLPHGAMASGWLTERGDTYFLNPTRNRPNRNDDLPYGAMFIGVHLIDGLNRTFDSSGRLFV